VLELVARHHREKIALCEQVIANDDRMFADATIRECKRDIIEHKSMLACIEQAMQELDNAYPKWMHVKRGGVYSEVGKVTIQADNSVFDDDVLTLYRDVISGSWYARPPEEFTVNRFLPVKETTAPQEGERTIVRNGITLVLEPSATLKEIEAFDRAALPVEMIEIVLKTGEDDDRLMKFHKQDWAQLRANLGRFSITHLTSDDEDMWGDWLTTAIDELPNGKIVAYVRRV